MGYIQARQKATLRFKETVGTQYTWMVGTQALGHAVLLGGNVWSHLTCIVGVVWSREGRGDHVMGGVMGVVLACGGVAVIQLALIGNGSSILKGSR